MAANIADLPGADLPGADLPGSDRPHTTVVLAMSADGKIADAWRSPARFGSAQDKSHLETQIAQADGVLFGAGTLRAYGSTLRVTHPDLLQQRQQQGKPPQPVHIVCTQSAQLDPNYAFFRQPVPRWLLTTVAQANRLQMPEFERVIAVDVGAAGLDWVDALQQFRQLGLERLVVTGGGDLVASLVAVEGIDEMWLTVCPLLLGGRDAPTPLGGVGVLERVAPRLELLGVEAIAQEVFLHYRVLSKLKGMGILPA
jgi:5-amino-6-(5-phosphoribosylamino)uracil reductase